MVRNLMELMDYLDEEYDYTDIYVYPQRIKMNDLILPINLLKEYEYTGMALEIFDDAGSRIDVFYRIRPIGHGGTVLYI